MTTEDLNNRLLRRADVMKSITAEYNRKRTNDGLRLAWIEKAVNDTPTAQIWHSPDKELPDHDEFVVVLLTGTVNGIRNEHAPHIADWADDGDGWILVHDEEMPGDGWTVDTWAYIPEFPEKGEI